MDSFRNFLNRFKQQDKQNAQTAGTGNDSENPGNISESDDSADSLSTCAAVIYQHVRGTRKASSSALIGALKSLEQIGTPALIHLAYPLCVDKEQGVRKQAWQTIEALLRDTPIHRLPSFSFLLRKECGSVMENFNGVERSMPLKVVGLLSFNRSGFVREAAVRELVARFDGKELPYIILAANDWVANIHVLATEALEKRANKQYAPYLVENLSLLRRLWLSGRHLFGKLQEDVENLVSAEIGISDLPGLFSIDPERQLWIYAYRLAIEAPDKSVEEIDELIKFGLHFKDMRIQQIAASKALKRFSPEKLQQFVPVLLQHHLPQIRREGLRWVVDNKWDDYKKTLVKSLFDRSMSVRLLAQFHTEHSKCLSMYEENLREQKFPLEATLRGLYEIKASIARDYIESFICHDSGKVRAAAFSLLLQSKPSDVQKIIMRELSDPSAYCAKEAFNFLRGNRELLSAADLWELLNSVDSIRGKKTSISAMARLGKWQSLEYLFLAKSCISPDLQVYLDQYLSDWSRSYNYSFIKLTKEEYERCMDAIAKCDCLVSSETRRTFELILKDNLRIS